MNKLTRLTINKFRNVAPTTLEFRPGLNVLLGRNAAGKTTLLRLLSTLISVPDETLQDEPVDASYYVTGEPFDIEHRTTRVRLDESALLFDPHGSLSKSTLSLQQTDFFTFKDDGETFAKVELSPNSITVEKGQKKDVSPIALKGNTLVSAAAAIWHTENTKESRKLAIEIIASRVSTAGRMDESLERFNNLLKLEASTEGISGDWTTTEYPYSMIELLSGSIPEGVTAEYSPIFLERAAHVLGYRSASMRFDVVRLSPEPSRQVVRLRNLRFFFERPGENIPHELLSYGQKRLLAFFAHADASPDVIIADELVNGLHHEWISACLNEIGERQAFLTSQNPLLLDFLRFESIEEVRHTFIICERSSSPGDAQLIWRNLTEDEAESFFLAYQTGIQRVSDILLTKGFW